MAINIQEILHPSDSDSIKFEKINYNFDQLVVNGGGPAGPKGEIGNTGSTGLTGQQGVTGDKGNKGESGETTSPWKNIAIDLNLSDGKNNVRILKPKPGTDLESPIIWLGDSSFLDEGSNASDGDTTLRSTLNVGRHYDFGGSSVNAEYATFWHNANAKIKLDSEDVTDGSNNYTRFNLSAVEPIVSGSNPEDIRFSINLPTTHTGEFRLNNFNITGNFEDGMLRYNSGANKFEGYINNAWVELCTAPCGSGGSSGSISISGTNLNLNVDGSLVNGGNPTYQYSDWNGSIAVDAAGAVTINNGNATSVTTDPVGPVAENITAGTNSVSFSVTVTVPSNYNNVGSTVAGSYTATQPTNYSAPSTVTGQMDLNYGSPGGTVCSEVGTSAIAVPVTITGILNPSNAEWQTAARNAALAYFNANPSFLPAGDFFKVTAISDHNNGAIPILNEFVEYDGNGILGDVNQCPSQQYTVTIGANSAIANASIYNVASGGSPNNTITRTGGAGDSIGDAFYVEANAGFNISPSQVSISSWGGGGSNTYVNPNVNSAGRVVVGWSDTIDPNNLSFDIGIAGSVSQLTYTVDVVETTSSSTICSETVSNTFFTYPQGEGGVNFQNYLLNNYPTPGNSDLSIKVISSNEPGFSWEGWAITMNSANEPLNGGWFNCNSGGGGGGGSASVAITGANYVYTVSGAEDYLATPTNIFGSGGNGNPSFSWQLSGINANKFALTNASSQTCTVDYIGTNICDAPHSAILAVTATGFDLNGQSISPVSNTKTISGCDDTNEGGSSGG